MPNSNVFIPALVVLVALVGRRVVGTGGAKAVRSHHVPAVAMAGRTKRDMQGGGVSGGVSQWRALNALSFSSAACARRVRYRFFG